jgi:hypothetical protein
MKFRAIIRAAVVCALAPVAVLIWLNAFINLGLPVLINHQPERLQITYDVAWMFEPGVVGVKGLHIRQQSEEDQWILDVDSATGDIDLAAAFDHTFHAYNLRGHGASFRYRVRDDVVRLPVAAGGDGTPAADAPAAPPTRAEVNAEKATEKRVEKRAERKAADDAQSIAGGIPIAPTVDMTPPIPGFTNPPHPNPDLLYGRIENPIRIVLDDIQADGVREIWMEDYRFLGQAHVHGNLVIEAHKYVEVTDAAIELEKGDVVLGQAPILTELTGRIDLAIAGMDPMVAQGQSLFGFITARAKLDARIGNLSFLDFYLRDAPWLALSGGVGDLAIDLLIEHGEFRDGSKVSADATDIVARFLSYSVVGDGRVELAVGTREGTPETRMSVDFSDYAITHDGDTSPHVKGKGFRVSARTPDVALDRPFSALNVVLELPESEIPDVGVYNAYMPLGIGLAIRGGEGAVHGRLEVSTVDNVGHGEMFLTGKNLRLTLDDLTITADLLLHAVVPEARLDEGKYDISGTRLELRHVGVADKTERRGGKDASDGWWANIALPHGKAEPGAPVFLDASLVVQFRDSVPFVTVFSAKQPLPGWVRGLLGAKDVSGSARLRLGDDVLHIPAFQVRGGPFEILLQLRRKSELMYGSLYARYGKVSLGMALNGTERRIQMFKAREWYDAQPAVK